MSDVAETKVASPTRFAWGYLVALVIWLAVVGALYLVFSTQLQPRVATAAGSEAARGDVVIPRSRDGHYYVAGSINGHPVSFLVDTGASTITVSQAFARQASLPTGIPTQFQTAGGTITGETVSGLTVEVAGIVISGMSVGVGLRTSDQQIALLGQNFLRQVEMAQAADQVILRTRNKTN